MPWKETTLIPLKCYAGRLCAKPYDGHPKGCPNFGKRHTCPPQAKPFDLRYPGRWFVIWTEFDLGAHTKRMRSKHPEWSERQVYCCYYWQGTARKQLREQCAEFTRIGLGEFQGGRGDYIEYVPEAHGIDVTNTMKSIGIEMQWPPKTKTVHVAVAFAEDNYISPIPLKTEATEKA
jgi:hypothetical protein